MKIVASTLTATLALAGSLLPGLAPAALAEKVYTGEVCSVQVHKLTTGIKWETKLPVAEAEAQKDGKLVFWMHMLGKIDGAT
ncbi:MAG: hypothetical protein JSS83_00340 [Cyanobacteria bacterium SZAS LIN-3]|nr:hypothetical protein [Cyanobacteria bacterium SZAS LIN-3]